MKTTVKQLAAVSFIALILMVSNVKAEGTQAKASGYVNNENELRIEKWMIDSGSWNVKTNTIDFIDQSESELMVEDWMTTNWDLQNLVEEQADSNLKIENWMISDKTWSSTILLKEKENTLEIENWMLDGKVWNN